MTKYREIIDATLPHVDVSVPNVHNQSEEQIAKLAKSKLKQSTGIELDLGYLLLSLYLRGTWHHGLARFTDRNFCDYVRDVLGISMDNERILSAMERYAAFAQFEDEKVMGLVKIIGPTKADLIIRVMPAECDKATVMKMLNTARSTPSAKLLDALASILGPSAPGTRVVQDRRAETTLRFLQNRDDLNGLVGGKMFIPRHMPVSETKELSWLLTFERVRKDRNLSVDDMFAEMMKVWMDSLDEELRDKAKADLMRKLDLDELVAA